MKNQYMLYVIILITLLLHNQCSSKKTSGKQVSEPPNIVWITAEDIGPALGCYGDEYATTPALDKLAEEGMLYNKAFASAPICAPARSALITGLYATSLGTQHLRSEIPIPEFIKTIPEYLREAGYYCTNNSKTDYNFDPSGRWDENGSNAHWRNRPEGKPFFSVFNYGTTHEGQANSSDTIIFETLEQRHDPAKAELPPYFPQTEEFKKLWARQYDLISVLDQQVEDIIEQLKEDGLYENTIIFFAADHGFGFPRYKRWMYNSGIRVPLIIRVPEKYLSLAPYEPGSKNDQLVSFVDFAPTVLSLAGIEPPEYMQGKAFLGEYEENPRDFAYSFRARMDERFDLTRSVRDKQYRYRRNYMPHKIYGQYIEYLWRAPSMKSWEKAYKAGELNEVQSRFWEPKPAEELYNVEDDPHNVNNLVDDPEYAEVLQEMRQVNQDWLREIVDVGFIPEPIMLRISEQGDETLYDYVRSDQYPFDRILETAEMATMRDPQYVDEVINRLNDDNPIVRYWAATGCIILNEEASKAKDKLMEMADDPEVTVQVAAAEALYAMDEIDAALKILTRALKDENLMARVQALNVLEIMGDDAKPALENVRELVPEDPDSRGYDIRAGRRILEKFEDAS